MPNPIAVYPENFDTGNIVNAPTVLNSGITLNKWIATFKTTDGVYRFPSAVIAADVGGNKTNSKDYLVTTEYLTAVIGGISASPTPTSLNWNTVNNRYELALSNGTVVNGQSVPLATQSTIGLAKLATGALANQAVFDTSDLLSTTPNYVNTKMQVALAQAAAAAAAADIYVDGLSWDANLHKLSATRRNSTVLDVTVPLATQFLSGLLAYIVKAADFPTKKTDDTGSATPAFVNAAVTAAINALPMDKMLQSGAYDAATNILTLKVGDSAANTVNINIDMTTMLNDVINTIADATDTTRGFVRLNLGTQSGDDNNQTDALTTFGFVQMCTLTGSNAVKSAIIGLIPTGTTAVAGIVQLTNAGFTVLNPANTTLAVTPADLANYAGAAKAAAHPYATVASPNGNIVVSQAGTQTDQTFLLTFGGISLGNGAPFTGNGSAATPLNLNTGAGLAVNTGVLVNTQALVQGASVPASPVIGSRWENQSAGVVAGVPAGAIATWNGTAWKVDTNVAESASPQSWQIIGGVVRLDVTKAYKITASVRVIPNNSIITYPTQSTIDPKILTSKAVNGTYVGAAAVSPTLENGTYVGISNGLLNTIDFIIRFSAPVNNVIYAECIGVAFASEDLSRNPIAADLNTKGYLTLSGTSAPPTHADIGMSSVGNTVDGFLAVEVRELYI